MSDTIHITIAGNVTDTPELRVTSSGTSVTNFRVAATPRYQNPEGEWVNGETVFMGVDVWDSLAEHVCDSVKRGQRVVITGTMRQRSYETTAGEKRTVFEVKASDVALSLRWNSIVIEDELAGAGAPF